MKDLMIVTKKALKDAADEIRAKSGTTEKIKVEDLDDAIEAIVLYDGLVDYLTNPVTFASTPAPSSSVTCVDTGMTHSFTAGDRLCCVGTCNATGTLKYYLVIGTVHADTETSATFILDVEQVQEDVVRVSGSLTVTRNANESVKDKAIVSVNVPTFNRPASNQLSATPAVNNSITFTVASTDGLQVNDSITVFARKTSDGYYLISGKISAITNSTTLTIVVSQVNTVTGISPTPSGTLPITQNGQGIDVTQYAAADVNVPNSYEAADEGKVVDNGALVSQTAYPQTIDTNDTYDTTKYNSITVNVSGGASVSVLESPVGTVGNDSDIPSQEGQAVPTTIDAFFTVPPQHNQRIACVLRTQGPDIRYACVVGTYNLNQGRLEDCIGYSFGIH